MRKRKALVCETITEDLSGVFLKEVDLPDILNDQILIRVKAASVNFPDLLMTQGKYQHKPDIPFILGMEGAGIVEEIGSEASKFKEGDEVTFGSWGNGAFSNYVIVPENGPQLKSKNLNFEEAASFQTAYLTAYVSLVRRGELIKGENLLLDLIKEGKPIMICVWHGRLLFPSWYIRNHTSLHIVSSRHPDSEVLGRILIKWGYKLIKGSTNKGGSQVIRKISEIFNNGGIIAVTNDGPKGPLQIAKSGSASLAIKKNVKIISITGSATKYWQAKSWDNFMLPKPFGKIQIIISQPLKISEKPKTSKEEVKLLTDFINKHQNKADIMTGNIPSE